MVILVMTLQGTRRRGLVTGTRDLPLTVMNAYQKHLGGSGGMSSSLTSRRRRLPLNNYLGGEDYIWRGFLRAHGTGGSGHGGDILNRLPGPERPPELFGGGGDVFVAHISSSGTFPPHLFGGKEVCNGPGHGK
jgi:hypothetical protein